MRLPKLTASQWVDLSLRLASAFPVEISLFIGFFGWLQVFHFLRQIPGLDGSMPHSKVLTIVEVLLLTVPWVLFFVFLRREKQSPQVRQLFAFPCLLGVFFGMLSIASMLFFTFAITGMLATVALYLLVVLTLMQAILVFRVIFRGMRGIWKG